MCIAARIECEKSMEMGLGAVACINPHVQAWPHVIASSSHFIAIHSHLFLACLIRRRMIIISHNRHLCRIIAQISGCRKARPFCKPANVHRAPPSSPCLKQPSRRSSLLARIIRLPSQPTSSPANFLSTRTTNKEFRSLICTA